MANKRNYQKELDTLLESLKKEGKKPKLLLHACCAPCSSYTLEYLSEYFDITVFYYNPNISPKEEYDKRVEELSRLIKEMPLKGPVDLIPGRYDPQEFYDIAKGLEALPEGGERCFKCYRLRLLESAAKAKEIGADYFCTTLSISPYKNAEKLNEIGEIIATDTGIPYLVSDFKKKNGYKRSIELSAEYNLYRQNYCGCVYSRMQSLEKR
ncbi:MAG: epoxyqueuosine reductase QueH [Lachnospiraceae bacterium]|nr:epoxyqueuosine reductase QueH [Lachnospiraceae bacterium]